MSSGTSKIRSLVLFKEAGILLGLIGLCLILSLWTDNFLTRYNVSVVIRQVSYICIVAFGQTLVLLTGGIDLSVGSIAGLSAILTALMMKSGGIDPYLATVLGTMIGGLFGLVNGVLIAKVRINPFIATLATSEIFAGIILIITEGYPILNLPAKFNFLGQGMIWIIPVPVVFMAIIGAGLMYCLGNTPYGRNIYAIGGNRNAARLVGIRVEGMLISVYALAGLFAAFAGILFASRMSTGQPTIGATWVMPGITAAIIGGTSLSGGEGTVLGTFLGAVFMGVLANGIVLLSISSYWERVIVGLVVLLAVVIDVMRNRSHPFRAVIDRWWMVFRKTD